MAVSKKQRHLSPEVIYDFLKGGLARQEQERAQAHLQECPRCAALAVRGRLVMKWLRKWSVQAQNLAYCRVLLRNALAQATAEATTEKVSQRLSLWRRNAPARCAALFSLARSQAGRTQQAIVEHLKRLTKASGGLRITSLLPQLRPARLSRPRPVPGEHRLGQPGRIRSLIQIEPQGKDRLVIRGEFGLKDTPPPMVLLMSCRHRAVPNLKPLRRTPGQVGRFEARFTGLEPGRYIIAVEPTWVSGSTARGFPRSRRFP